MNDAGGWLWLLIDVALVGALGAALIYGIMKARNRPRGPRVEAARDRATENLYRQEERSSPR